MAKIVIGTTNPGKIREVASILSPLGHELNPASLDVDETGETIEENAKIKALAYSKEYPDVYVICEDSGLVVPGLNNLPGPYSARFHSIVMDDNLNVTEVPKEEFTTDKTELQHTEWLVGFHDLEKVRQSAKMRLCRCPFMAILPCPHIRGG